MTAPGTDGIRYRLAPGSQVREEDFGLLFYTQQGPGLYFVGSGNFLGEEFFEGRETLRDWYRRGENAGPSAAAKWSAVKNALESLREKGVILAC
ncbi:MAG: mycofactocin biosynthesis chaperone MftB [Desulfobacterota bacterium]|nr:mycofactocin biosynthesis chaperone MftB [Thermodesulfobacteriota bacterium]